MTERKPVLVTGAGGFIGSHLTEALVQAGRKVRAFILYNSFNSWGWLDKSPPEIKREIEIFAGDIRDSYAVRRAVSGCDTVFHLAALISVPYSYDSPETYIDTNIKGTLNVLQAVRDFEVRRIIHTSTSEVYGTAKFVPITEEHPLQPQSPYAASKSGADHIASAFFHSFGTPVVTIRPFNTFGPRQSARAVIPTIITQIAAGKKRLELGSLTPTRDFNYVFDTVRGFIAASQASNIEGEVINLGRNEEISIGETAQLIADIMKSQIEITTDRRRLRPPSSEVERLRADNAKAGRLLSWNPLYAGKDGLVRALSETVEWFCKPENTALYKSGIYNI